jgi:hypothetical protein
MPVIKWKVLPEEPTKRMTLEAFIHATLIAPDGWSLGTKESQEFFAAIYKRMVEVAPTELISGSDGQ